jgi:hypothetical protein
LFHSSSSFLVGAFVNPTNLEQKSIASDFCLEFTPKLDPKGGNVYNLNLKLDPKASNICNFDPKLNLEGNVCDIFLGDFLAKCT